MAGLPVYNETCLISKGLYRKVSDVVGPECFVKLRRQRWNIHDAFENCNSFVYSTRVTSGSRAEGFDFESSDFDVMFVERNAVVVTWSTLITAPINNISTIFLMETENVSPGFAFVRNLIWNDHNSIGHDCLVWRGSDVYLSSKRVRETFVSSEISTIHGPCQTYTFMGSEADEAYTLNCPFWPTQAISFVRRSHVKGWPSYDLLTEICNDGCLLVPINSKQQSYSDMIDLEWRISFSLAEKKLVYSMNHCQFLCYGLTKVFLNECLKKTFPNDDLLCSYFMKTTVFWEISDNPSEWTPTNFLSKFWNVFRRLIKWVSIGYCPNFFIPENNMFYGKICGEAQIRLLGTLCDLYKDGYWSLLRCSSLTERLSQLITEPERANTISCNEEDYVPFSVIEIQRLRVIMGFCSHITIMPAKQMMTLTMKTIALLKSESVVTVHLRLNHVFQAFTESVLFFLESSYSIRNRRKYKGLKASQTILRSAKTFFCINYFILIKQMYITGNYHGSKKLLHYIRDKIKSQQLLYKWSLDDNIILTALQQGMPYDTLIKSLIMSHIKMDIFTSIEELKLECSAQIEHTGGSPLNIPPLVFLNFLLLLTYTRLGENHRRHDVLDELHTLLYQDEGHHISIVHTAISWEILGICQQLCGDRHGARQSYIHALHDDYNYFKEATIARIKSLDNY